jgi:hypothetical protein
LPDPFLSASGLATATDSTDFGGMGALSQTVQIMFYRREEQALIDLFQRHCYRANLADHDSEIFDL